MRVRNEFNEAQFRATTRQPYMDPIELKAAYCQRVPVFEWEGHTYAQLKEIRITSATQIVPVVELDGLDFYCRNTAEGLVAFIGMDNNGSHAQVLTRDGRLVRRRIGEIALKIELGPKTLSNLAHLKRNGAKRG
jgi:hypothetical protein